MLALDSNAATLWPIFLKKVGLHVNAAGDIIENDGRRAEIVRRFGVQSLIQRLPRAKNERERARVWWRESIACSEGESELPDLTAERLYVTNPFIVTESLKYTDPRVIRLKSRKPEAEKVLASVGRPRKSLEEKRAVAAERQRRKRASARELPEYLANAA